MTSRLPLPLDDETRRRREQAVAEISAAVARGAYRVQAEEVAEAIVRTIRRPEPEMIFRRSQGRLRKLATWRERFRARSLERGAGEPELAHKGAW